MKTFEDFLQEEFYEEREFGGVSITKDNCENLFESWLCDLGPAQFISYATIWGGKIKIEMLEEEIKKLKTYRKLI